MTQIYLLDIDDKINLKRINRSIYAGVIGNLISRTGLSPIEVQEHIQRSQDKGLRELCESIGAEEVYFKHLKTVRVDLSEHVAIAEAIKMQGKQVQLISNLPTRTLMTLCNANGLSADIISNEAKKSDSEFWKDFPEKEDSMLIHNDEIVVKNALESGIRALHVKELSGLYGFRF